MRHEETSLLLARTQSWDCLQDPPHPNSAREGPRGGSERPGEIVDHFTFTPSLPRSTLKDTK